MSQMIFFVSGMAVHELMIRGSSVLLFLFQLENKKVDLVTMGFLIFGRQKFPVTCFATPYLFCPTLPLCQKTLLTGLQMQINIWDEVCNQTTKCGNNLYLR